MVYVLILVTLLAIFLLIWSAQGKQQQQPKTKNVAKHLNKSSQLFLDRKVLFYHNLNKQDKVLFEQRLLRFLDQIQIIGSNTDVTKEDRLLIGASAIIPVFSFPNWRYTNIHQVILFPSSFTKDLKQTGKHRTVLGMVGNGYLEGKMILSRKALHLGFENEMDKHNTAIHEFVHLIDKMDGNIDGIPELLMDKQYSLPWISLIEHKIDVVYKSRTEINPYGGTNRQEFFAVVSEYFFERPKQLKSKHPKLYELLSEIFKIDLTERAYQRTLQNTPSRNSPCPCGSGKKYKHCCLNS